MGGTHGDRMYCHSTQGWTSFKLEEVCDNRPTVDFKVNKGQMNNVLNSKHKVPPGLFGTPTETKVPLQDINTKALIPDQQFQRLVILFTRNILVILN